MSDIDKGEIITVFHKKYSTQQIAVVVAFVAIFLKDFGPLNLLLRNGVLEGRERLHQPKTDWCADSARGIGLKAHRTLKNELKDAIGTEIDASTVRRELREGGFHGQCPAKNTFLNSRIRKQRYLRTTKIGP